MKYPRIVFVVLFGLLSMILATGSADVLVDWGGTGYVSAHQNLGRPGTTDSGATWIRQYVNWSVGMSLNPSNGYDTGQNSATFYGGYHGYSSTQPNWDQRLTRVHDDAGGDSIRISFNDGDPTDTAYSVVWIHDDFMSGGDAGVVAPTNLYLNAAYVSSRGQLRFLVQDGAQWYVSEANLSGNTGVLSITTFSTANWAMYNPVGNSIANQATVYGAHTFTNVRGFGYNATITTDGNGMDVNISDFEAYGQISPIPEPATATLIVLCGLTITLLRRSRRIAD